jgi:hypothetical protein
MPGFGNGEYSERLALRVCDKTEFTGPTIPAGDQRCIMATHSPACTLKLARSDSRVPQKIRKSLAHAHAIPLAARLMVAARAAVNFLRTRFVFDLADCKDYGFPHCPLGTRLGGLWG